MILNNIKMAGTDEPVNICVEGDKIKDVGLSLAVDFAEGPCMVVIARGLSLIPTSSPQFHIILQTINSNCATRTVCATDRPPKIQACVYIVYVVSTPS